MNMPDDAAPSDKPKGRYRLVIYDNFHYMDESEVYESGSYETYDDAVAAAKAIMREFLHSAHKPGMSANELHEIYVGFGEDPTVAPSDTEPRFSAWDFAKAECAEICGEPSA